MKEKNENFYFKMDPLLVCRPYRGLVLFLPYPLHPELLFDTKLLDGSLLGFLSSIFEIPVFIEWA